MLPSLADAPWFRRPELIRALAVLNGDGIESRVVGGAVRNALMGLPIGDIDVATTARPDEVMARAAAAGIKAVPTGFEHGTVTIVVDRHPFEVTTLREDVETHGRRATVVFGSDWGADARRRDFAMNALYLDASGNLHDPVGGYPDILNRHVRFIGDAATRIREDYLRILRFFRFHAAYGRGAPDAEGLHAAIDARNGLRILSAERIGQEMRRLVTAPGAPETIAVMAEAGILEIVFAGVVYTSAFAHLRDIVSAEGLKPNAARALAVAGAAVAEDCNRIADRLRLSNADRGRMLAAVGLARHIGAMPEPAAIRRLVYGHGNDAATDALLYAWCHGRTPADDPDWHAALKLAHHWQAPKFPFSGRDAIAAGLPRGPVVGRVLDEVEAWWIAADFPGEIDELHRVLQQKAAAALTATAD